MGDHPRIVLTGGGSGGHVYPAVAIAETAKQKFPGARLLYVGTRRGAESKVAPARGIDIAYISIESFRNSILSLALFGGRLIGSVLQARSILARFKPDLLIATGGYSSAPVLLAAAMLRRTGGGGRPKILIHEQNVVAGLANRLGGKFADRIATTFPGSNRYFPAGKVVHTGYPLRAEIAAMGREEARERLGLDPEAYVVFAFGGSAGARTINRAIVDALEALLARGDVHVIHAIGRYRGSDYDPEQDTRQRLEACGLPAALLQRYHQLVYTDEIETYYSAADVVVSRCGSGTLFELKKAGRPAILIPKMGSAGEHQLHNALAVQEEGTALVIREDQDRDNEKGVMKVEGRELAEKLLMLKDNPEKREAMAKLLAEESRRMDTSKKISEILEELLGG